MRQLFRIPASNLQDLLTSALEIRNLGSVQWGLQYAHVWICPWAAGKGPNSANANKVFSQLQAEENMKERSDKSVDKTAVDRRSFLSMALGTCAITPLAPLSLQFATSLANSLTKEERDSMTPSQVIDELKKGNERFRAKKTVPRDYLAEKRSSAAGQYPAAVILGCLDSRVPAEIIFDTGIGDTYIGRVAGNVVNEDLLGSMEFACAASGAKAVLVLGHTDCGAVKGAIDGVVLGNLTGLLARIKPAISATKFEGEKSSKNAAYVDAVARTNVVLALAEIRRSSPVLEELEKKGTILIAGAMYRLTTGVVEFF